MADRWKSLADQLGAPGFEPTVRPSPEGNPLDSESKPAHPPSLVDSVSVNPASTVDRTTKRKKKASWGERLANLLGVAAPEEESLPPATSSTDQASVQAQDESKAIEPALFDSSATEAPNPVLTEMFGAPKTPKPSYWDKPKRMVDDIGWDDDESYASKPATTSLPGDAEVEADDDKSANEAVDSLTEDDTSETRRRPRRRRRRGGRREFGDADSGTAGAAAEKDDAREVSGFLDESDRDTDWSVRDEVETTPSRTSNEKHRSSSPSSRNRRDENASEEELADRRSSRRRRRRGPDRQEEDGSGSENGRDSRPPRSSLATPSTELEPDGVSRLDVREPGEDERDELEGQQREPRGRRRKRPRGSERRTSSDELSQADSPAPKKSPSHRSGERNSPSSRGTNHREEGDEELDSELHAETKSHRNIPTWEDALASVITANLENHRRNDHRSQRGSGGRSKGRR